MSRSNRPSFTSQARFSFAIGGKAGPRQYLIPDFLIAAHASTQADRLAAVDRGYLRRYFPELNLPHPSQ